MISGSWIRLPGAPAVQPRPHVETAARLVVFPAGGAGRLARGADAPGRRARRGGAALLAPSGIPVALPRQPDARRRHRDRAPAVPAWHRISPRYPRRHPLILRPAVEF